MIGIIGAMESEVAGLIEKMEDAQCREISMVRLYIGRLCGEDAVVARAGVGKVSAAVTAQTMILEYKPELLIFTGVAGSLSKDVRVWDLVISDETAEHDMDTSALGDPVGFISGLGVIRMKADKDTADRLYSLAQEMAREKAFGEDADTRVFRGLIVSGDQFIATKEQRDRIHKNFPDALCTEMEGASIGHVCYQNGVPFCIIRSISDNSDDETGVDFNEFVNRACRVSNDLVLRFLESRNRA